MGDDADAFCCIAFPSVCRSGFVPGVRNTYAKRYGASTEQEMLAHAVRFPRHDNQSNTFARTQLPRENYPLSSAPLPGGALSQEAPTMYIPEHVRYLKFFPSVRKPRSKGKAGSCLGCAVHWRRHQSLTSAALRILLCVLSVCKTRG
jgi:hypothetical protein